jgi:hypothetical protein
MPPVSSAGSSLICLIYGNLRDRPATFSVAHHIRIQPQYAKSLFFCEPEGAPNSTLLGHGPLTHCSNPCNQSSERSI